MQLVPRVFEIISLIKVSEKMSELWQQYSLRYDWAQDLAWKDVLTSTEQLLQTCVARLP